MCDNCVNPPAETDYTHQARKFLSCVKRTGESFGYSHIVDVLRGSESKILERGHQNLGPMLLAGNFRKRMTLGRRLTVGGSSFRTSIPTAPSSSPPRATRS